jgi:thymidylate synthase (FAD)
MRSELIDHMGTDLTVVNAARVSFDKESEWERQHFDYISKEEDVDLRELKNDDVKLINYLANHGHWTPFSHCTITLRETVPIFVARQRFKHMVGFAYNEVSRRYVDDAPEFYTPEVWRSKPVNAKQGSGTEVIEWLYHEEHEVWDEPQSPFISTSIKEEYAHFIEYAEYLYKLMIDNGVAPEQARMILPQSMYTSYYTTGSLAAWARAYKLRTDSHAQLEIQELAKQWNDIIQPLFPVSWAALTT